MGWDVDWDKDRGSGKQQMYPNGVYRMIVSDYQYITTKAGKDMLTVELLIKSKGEFYDQGFTLWIDEKRKWLLVALTDACGVEVEGKMGMNTLAFNKVLDKCKGSKVILTIEENPRYNNNTIKYIASGEVMLATDEAPSDVPDIQIPDTPTEEDDDMMFPPKDEVPA